MEGDLQREFGRNVRALREQRELSQEGLADELGLHRTYIGGVERGERNLSLQTVERFSASLGTDPLVLLGAPHPRSTGLRAAASGDDPGATPSGTKPRRPRP